MKELLIELQNECIELASAGSDLSIGSFKLGRLLPKFEKIGEKAKPFKMVSDRINSLLNSSKEESEDNLISLASLVNAIVMTQADTDLDGELIVEAGTYGKINTNTSSRIIAPVVEALTTIGGGRYNVIENAIKEGLFLDSRLFPLLVGGLSDKYAEISELIYQKLSSEDHPELLSILQESFDRNGKRGDALKLSLIGKILGEVGKDFYIDLLEDSSKEVKAEAVLILGNLKDTEEIILQQAKSKLKEVRKAAYFGIVKINPEKAKEELIKVIKKSDYSLVMEAVADQDTEVCAEILLEGFKDTYEKKLEKESESGNDKLIDILNEMQYHKSEKILEFLLQCMEDDKISNWNTRVYGRSIFVERKVVECVIEYDNIPKKAIELLESRKERNFNRIFDLAFKVSLESRTPQEVYEMYSPYLIKKTIDKNIVENTMDMLSRYLGYKIDNGERGFYTNLSKTSIQSMMKQVNKEFDKRWVGVFKKYGAYCIMACTIDKEDKDIVKYMIDTMYNLNNMDGKNRGRFAEFSTNLMYILIGLIKVECEEAHEVVLEKVKATTGYDFISDSTLFLIPYLPNKYIKEIEDFVVDLKSRNVYIDNSYLETRVESIEEALALLK